MRILHATDIHHHSLWLEWLQGASAEVDLVCVTGDLIDLFASGTVSLGRQIRNVTEWANGFTTPLAVCSGNHDWLPAGDALPHNEADAQWIRALRRPGQVFVDGDDVAFANYRLISMPWLGGSIPVPDGRPTILLSHVGPLVSGVATSAFEDLGDSGVREFALHASRPSFVLSGHVHDARWLDIVGNCICLNPGRADRAHPFPAHVRIDTDAHELRYLRADAAEIVVRWKPAARP